MCHPLPPETLQLLIQDRLHTLYREAEHARLLRRHPRSSLSLRLGRWRLKLEPLEPCMSMRHT